MTARKDDGMTRRRDDGFPTIQRKRERGTSDFCDKIYENRIRKASYRTVIDKDTFG